MCSWCFETAGHGLTSWMAVSVPQALKGRNSPKLTEESRCCNFSRQLPVGYLAALRLSWFCSFEFESQTTDMRDNIDSIMLASQVDVEGGSALHFMHCRWAFSCIRGLYGGPARISCHLTHGLGRGILKHCQG